MGNNCMESKENNKLEEVFYENLSKYEFEIPIYQRPYAWKPEEVETLLNDLKEYYEEKENKNDEGYFLGTLVVNSLGEENGKKKLEVIDGQQRLTTLYLISAVFKDSGKINLSYEIRESDKKFLKELPDILEKVKVLDKKGFTEEFINEIKKRDIQFHLISENILENLYDILKWINGNKIENPSKLLEKVYFVLAYIPENTDVAKFFEVMNSRGKQLEQHQVLKARFLEIIKKDEENKIDYAKIWDFCSNMNYYLEDLIYYSLDEKEKKADKENTKIKKIRENLIKFTKEKTLNDLEGEIYNYFKLETNSNNQQGNNQRDSQEKDNKHEIGTLGWILENSHDKAEKESERKYLPEAKEVGSIVKFSVFLLHTLRLFKRKALNKDEYKEILNELPQDISLDDKKLLESFGKENKAKEGKRDKNKLFLDAIEDKNKIEVAKKFVLFLLKMRILFDYFIFKRSNILEGEDVKLRKLKIEEGGLGLGNTDRTLINLQLLFSFTSPNYFQQEWLTPALSWLCENLNKDIDNSFYEDFVNFLERLDRVLSLARLDDKSDLKSIFKNFAENTDYDGGDINLKDNIKNKLEETLNKGTATEHYWFYKFEYLLWKNSDSLFNKDDFKNNNGKPFDENDKFKYSEIKKNYRLTRKNSIEHIKPQSQVNKEEGWLSGEVKNLKCSELQNECHIDCFGNLALISNHLNSALLDKSFNEKRRIIENQLERGTIESLKMLLVYSKHENWTPKECKEHYEKMLNLLENHFKGEPDD